MLLPIAVVDKPAHPSAGKARYDQRRRMAASLWSNQVILGCFPRIWLEGRESDKTPMPLSRDTTLNVVAAGDPLDRFSTEGETKIRSETPNTAGFSTWQDPRCPY